MALKIGTSTGAQEVEWDGSPGPSEPVLTGLETHTTPDDAA